MEIRKIILVITTLLLFGCDTEFYEALSRIKGDPFIEAPEVISFKKEDTIFISWREDKMADTYVLERAEDNSSVLLFREIYRGKEVSYIDREVVDEKLYQYRLYKQRGSKNSWVSGSVLGIGSAIRMDEHEPNDKEEDATWIGPMRISNIFYYKAHDGQVVSDEDWYYVTVPSYTRATIIVEDYQVGSAGAATHFKIIIKGGGTAAPVTNNYGIDLVNPDSTEKRILFKIIADESKFVTSPARAGGALVQYSIYLWGTTRL